MLAVARALTRRGHEVVFLSGMSHRDDAERAGASFALLPSAGGSPLHDLRPYDDATAQARALGPLLEEVAPDGAVVDTITAGAALAAEAYGIPFASLVVHPLHLPSRTLPPFGYGRRAGHMPLGRFRDAWMRANNRKDLERARADLNRGRARLGLAPTDGLVGGMSERCVLVATLPSLEIPRPDWPEHAHVVGPCLWDVAGDGFEPPSGDGPLVLIAPSTAYDGDRMLPSALDAVARLGVRAILATGASAAPVTLPAGVTAALGVRHASILPHVDAAICNGGHGTVVRALSAGVPLIVVPGHGDQQENAWRVQRSGAGVQVRFPSPRSVRRGLRRVLARPRFRVAAQGIASEAASIEGPARAADLIEGMLRDAETTEGGLAPAPLPNGGLFSTPPRGRRRPSA